ncbi:hypothetical protein QU38_01820, partial [Staphylococcus aureus]
GGDGELDIGSRQHLRVEIEDAERDQREIIGGAQILVGGDGHQVDRGIGRIVERHDIEGGDERHRAGEIARMIAQRDAQRLTGGLGIVQRDGEAAVRGHCAGAEQRAAGIAHFDRGAGLARAGDDGALAVDRHAGGRRGRRDVGRRDHCVGG